MQLKEGTLLQSGKYRIEKVLGQGGFGITYQAEQPSLRRKVAIKEFFMKEYCERSVDTSAVSMGTSGSKELVGKFREKFVKEAQNIAGLNHGNIIKVHDVFEENNTAYYVMEYLDCGSLSDYIAGKGRLSEAESEVFIKQIASALSYIHERKINHLDVKPGNILLDENNNAVLIDFGLSKHYTEDGGQTSSTPVGISRGYAPMEQYKQGGVSKFSPESDIYSLGATLYKMVTGSTPPEADDVNENGLSFPSELVLSERVKQAITFAMQPKRKDRPQSVGEFLAILESKTSPKKEDTYLEVKVDPVPEPAPVPGPTPTPVPDPNPRGKWIILLILSVILCFGGYFVYACKPIKYNGTYVDLGLSVEWGDCNLGTDDLSEYGEYYKWRKAKRKQNSTWRLPTKAELEELETECTWEWTTHKGVKGYKVTGPNGNSIFLPAAGDRIGLSLYDAGEYGEYWSSTPDESDSIRAYFLIFNSGYQVVDCILRDAGLSVRPVSE